MFYCCIKLMTVSTLTVCQWWSSPLSHHLLWLNCGLWILASPGLLPPWGVQLVAESHCTQYILDRNPAVYAINMQFVYTCTWNLVYRFKSSGQAFQCEPKVHPHLLKSWSSSWATMSWALSWFLSCRTSFSSCMVKRGLLGSVRSTTIWFGPAVCIYDISTK